MRTLPLAVAASILALAVSEGRSFAINLPDTSSPCNTEGADGCLKINNSFDFGKGITAYVAAGGAIVGSTQAGTGVAGKAIGGAGVQGIASQNGAGVIGTSDSGYGVIGRSTSGDAAIWGDANHSWITWAGKFSGDIEARALYQTSDARLKTGVENLPHGLPQLLKLRPVTYKWKKEGSDGRLQMGLIAQEVEKVVPEVVRLDRASGMLTVDYIGLLPVAIKAIQDQQKMIQQQEARIAALEQARVPLKASMFSGDAVSVVALSLLCMTVAVSAYRRRKQRAS
jgi:hypothetical protein